MAKFAPGSRVSDLRPGPTRPAVEPGESGLCHDTDVTPDPVARHNARTRRVRLDQLLVERGLVETRSRAQALVLAGKVRVGDGDSARLDHKPGDALDPATAIEVARPEPYVSRGGHKLAAALDAFEIDPTGLTALDVGEIGRAHV